MTKVRADKKGLFVITGGWVGRPTTVGDIESGETSFFKVGDEVKAHHFGGSQIIGVGDKDCDFRKRKGYEIWWVDDLSPEVKKIMTMGKNIWAWPQKIRARKRTKNERIPKDSEYL